MAMIPLNLDDIQEQRPVSLGQYDLTIASCEEVLSKKGKPQLSLSIGIDGMDDAPNIRHFISLPADGDEPDAMKFKALLLKRFCALFKVALKGSAIDTEALANSMVGARARAEVRMEKETDADGNEKPDGRVYNRITVPYLKDEGQVSGGGGKVPKPPKS